MRKGKHSRFARHLQLEAGSKTMAELIIYAGRYDPQFLNKAHEAQARNGASQPAAEPALRQQLKRAAEMAKLEYRKSLVLRRRLDKGEIDPNHLGWWQQKNLQSLENGSLLERMNHAVAAFGHGRLRNGDNTVDIGGSTGGVTRLRARRVRRARPGHLLGHRLKGTLGTAVLLSLR